VTGKKTVDPISPFVQSDAFEKTKKTANDDAKKDDDDKKDDSSSSDMGGNDFDDEFEIPAFLRQRK